MTEERAYAFLKKKNHIPAIWKLFRDSPRLSVKAVLLQNGKRFPSILVSHTVWRKRIQTWQPCWLLLNKLNKSGKSVVI